MPGGRGEDERNMFAEELIAMRNQRVAQEEPPRRCSSVPPDREHRVGYGEAAGRGVCADRDELREWLSFGDWSNGSAFAIEGTRKRTAA